MITKYKVFEDNHVIFRSHENFAKADKVPWIDMGKPDAYYKFYDVKREFYSNPFYQPINSKTQLAWALRVVKHLNADNPRFNEDVFITVGESVVRDPNLCRVAFRENNDGIFLEETVLPILDNLVQYVWDDDSELERRKETRIVFNNKILYKQCRERLEQETTGEDKLDLLAMYKSTEQGKDYRLDDIERILNNKTAFDYSSELHGEELTYESMLRIEVRLLKRTLRKLIYKGNYDELIDDAMQTIHDTGERITAEKIGGIVGLSRVSIQRKLTQEHKIQIKVLNNRINEMVVLEAYQELFGEPSFSVNAIYKHVRGSINKTVISKVVKSIDKRKSKWL